MCMFQDIKVKPTNKVTTGYKVVLVVDQPDGKLKLYAPIQRSIYRRLGKWHRTRTPGFNIFRKRGAAISYKGSIWGTLEVIKVRARQLIWKEPGEGFCALEMLIPQSEVTRLEKKYGRKA